MILIGTCQIIRFYWMDGSPFCDCRVNGHEFIDCPYDPDMNCAFVQGGWRPCDPLPR